MNKMCKMCKELKKLNEKEKLIVKIFKEIEEEQKNKTGWFSKEEDEYWEGVGD